MKHKLVRKKLHTYRRSLFIAAAGSVVAAIGIAVFIYFTTPITLQYQLSNIRTNASMKVSFNQEVGPHLNYSVAPQVDGSWHKHRGLFGIRSVEFVPAKPLTPGASYQLMVGHVAKIGLSKPAIDTRKIPVTTEPPADLSSITPGDTAQSVAINPTITVTLKGQNHGLRKLKLSSDAGPVLGDPVVTGDRVYTWKFASNLAQDTTYHLFLDDLNQTDVAHARMASTNFTTLTAPKITDATQTDHFYTGSPIVIAFDQPMVQVDSIFSFDAKGSGHWTTPARYEYVPTGLKPATRYPYRVLAGAKTAAGGTLEADTGFAVATPGAAYVTSSSPGGSNVAINSSIGFSFDQPVDHATAEAAFSINPATTGSFSWSGTTMSFRPAGLGYQTGYTASLKPGIIATFGTPSTKSFSVSFSTTYQTVKLNVPLYKQVYSLSCEEAALRMALAYRGISASDYDILQRVGYSPRPRDTGSNSWDNPYQMYVGDVNGSQGSTGWGVYAPPIAAAAQSFGRSASVINNISAGQIAQAIYDGNPVIVWGFSGSQPILDSWNTSSGTIQLDRNEHTRTVIGVAGSPANPIGFYLNDPYFGSIYWTTAQLNANMSSNGNLASQAVVIY